MDAIFVETINALVKRRGKEALFDIAVYQSYIPNNLKKFSKERHALYIAIEAGAGKEIDVAQDIAAAKYQLVSRLKDQFFIAGDIATDTIDLLAYILRGDRALNIAQTHRLYALPINDQKPRNNAVLIAIIILIILLTFIYLFFGSTENIQEPPIDNEVKILHV
jgi:hypothetical protein